MGVGENEGAGAGSGFSLRASLLMRVQRIQELIQDFELKTDWRVEIVAYNPAASKISTVVKHHTLHIRITVCGGGI